MSTESIADNGNFIINFILDHWFKALVIMTIILMVYAFFMALTKKPNNECLAEATLKIEKMSGVRLQIYQNELNSTHPCDVLKAINTLETRIK